MKNSSFLSAIERGDIQSAIKLASSSQEDREILIAALGDHFFKAGNIALAKRFYFESMSAKPNPAAEFGFGSCLVSEGRPKESIPFLVSSSRHESHMLCSLLKLGMASRMIGDIKNSLRYYLEARSKGYNGFVVDFNIANLLCDLGKFDEAEEYYERGIKAAPDDKAKLNYSMFLLSRGHFHKGLEYYESRPWCFNAKGSLWSGERNKRVLVLTEQGYGDLIHFARFLPALKSVSEKVLLACDSNIAGFVSSVSGLDGVVELNQDSIDRATEDCPFYCRIMSIPFLMDIDVANYPSDPYLKPDPERCCFWKKVLSEQPEGLNVGLCWHGGRAMSEDKKRSLGLSLIDELLNVEGANFYSLQKDWRGPHPKIKCVMDMCGDFMDTASLIENMDLIISVDTSVAHVAGAIGKRVWMINRMGGCWRWMNEGDETFWYPSMKIFRQSSVDDWAPTISRIAAELRSIVSHGN